MELNGRKLSRCTCLVVIVFFRQVIIAYQESIYVENGGNATLKCPYEDESVVWRGIGGHQYSQGDQILTSLPIGLQQRCSIEKRDGYNLVISEISLADEGDYSCSSENQSVVITKTLFRKEPPTGITITNGDNGIIQTDENKSIVLNCKAIGGQPTPTLTLMLEDTALVSKEERAVSYTLTLNRTDDFKNLTCYAQHSLLATPITDTAMIVLNLAATSFRMDSLPVLYEGRHVNISFDSSGSRPPAQVKCVIDNEFINATVEEAILQPDGAYKVESTIEIDPKRNYNKKIIICHTTNKVNRIETSQEMEVYYPPSIRVKMVKDTTTDPNMIQISCEMDGNPKIYNYHNWKQSSQFDEPIRDINQKSDGMISFPMTNKTVNYKNIGKYTCLGDNGITDSNGDVVQSSTITLEYGGPPHLTAINNLNQTGDIGTDVTITVPFVSILPLKSNDWYSELDGVNNTSPLNGIKYNKFITSSIVQDIVYNKTVHANGHICSLSIKNLTRNDFGTYRFVAENSNGQLSVSINLKEKVTDKAFITILTEPEYSEKITGIVLTVVGSLMIIANIAFFIWKRRETSTCYPLQYTGGDEMNIGEEEPIYGGGARYIPDIDHHGQTLTNTDSFRESPPVLPKRGGAINNDEEETTFVEERYIPDIGNHEPSLAPQNDQRRVPSAPLEVESISGEEQHGETEWPMDEFEEIYDDAEYDLEDTVTENQDSLPGQRARCPSPQSASKDGEPQHLSGEEYNYPETQFDSCKDEAVSVTAAPVLPPKHSIPRARCPSPPSTSTDGSITEKNEELSLYISNVMCQNLEHQIKQSCDAAAQTDSGDNEFYAMVDKTKSSQKRNSDDGSITERNEESTWSSSYFSNDICQNLEHYANDQNQESRSYFSNDVCQVSENMEYTAMTNGDCVDYQNDDGSDLSKQRRESSKSNQITEKDNYIEAQSSNETHGDPEETKPKEPPRPKNYFAVMPELQPMSKDEIEKSEVQYTRTPDDSDC